MVYIAYSKKMDEQLRQARQGLLDYLGSEAKVESRRLRYDRVALFMQAVAFVCVATALMAISIDGWEMGWTLTRTSFSTGAALVMVGILGLLWETRHELIRTKFFRDHYMRLHKNFLRRYNRPRPKAIRYKQRLYR